jgi:crotonobetainyl-CoA:carnitine CoA-transferase CaiB-like acyl-CoA transferase
MLPLDGIRVLDMSQVMAGPFCCMLLGDMGADVIKVEPPAGDQTRSAMGHRMKGQDSPGFLALNRNKRSIALDLKKEADRRIFHDLVRTADILVENSRPGVAARLGAGYDTLREFNPRLIYASISGFGDSGPWAMRPGFDLISQAMTGVISATGTSNGELVKSTIPVGDLGASLFTVYGILSALYSREKTGEGQWVGSSLFEAALGLSIWETSEYWATGQPPQPLGTANRMSAPYQAVRASDGHFVFGAANEKLWRAFVEAIGRQDLAGDLRYASNADRMKHRETLIETLSPVFLTRTVEEWVDLLLKAGVPAGPIYDYGQALNSEHAAIREMIQDVPHPVEGMHKALGFPVKLSRTPQRVRRGPPLLDEHKDEILGELYSKPA